MKKFKFKLQPVLKLREFKEQVLKAELGVINQNMIAVEAKIESLNLALDESYLGMETAARSGMMGLEIQFYPQYQDGIRADIQRQKNRLYALRLNYVNKMKELQKQRGEVKVMESMKEKYLHQFKREKNKQIEKDSFELYQMSRTNKKGDEG